MKCAFAGPARILERFGSLDPAEIAGRQMLERLQSLPGFGKQKAQIFVALVGKQLGVRSEGWAEAAGDYA